MLELVTRRFLKVGSTHGANYVKEANDIVTGDPESSMFMYNDRPIVRRTYLKCMYCRYRLKPKVCEKFACTRDERKDDKSIIFCRI